MGACVFRILSFGFQVSGFRFRVSGVGFQISGFGMYRLRGEEARRRDGPQRRERLYRDVLLRLGYWVWGFGFGVQDLRLMV